ncbi:MarC family protein [Poseidonibacter antarcticus]|uniref:MarC family protein n=1 Tax=Poseidonibacter antarcticus TaxID=2478538 RepID=UPI000EF54365|nr:MarC family protein [Poseidonibacter antarcticus]
MLPISEYIQVMIGIATIFSPFAALPIFVSLTADNTKEEKNQTARTTSMAAFITGLISVWIGQYVLLFFGISISSFKIAGGLLLLLMAISMLNAKTPDAKNTKEELKEAQEKSSDISDIAVVPLAIPLIAGPGSISTIIIYSQQSNSFYHLLMMSGIVGIICMYIFLTLRMATFISRKLGVTGINIITRVMGLILASISIEFIISGLLTVFPILSIKAF